MKKQILSLIVCGLLAACTTSGGGGLSADALRTRLDNPTRSEEDKARDAGRKPADVVTFLGINDGMTVLDIIAASGYYTEVLANAVGPTGTVYAQNPAIVLRFRDGANDKALQERLADNRLPNVVRWDHEFRELGLATNSLDAAVTALNLHDVYNQDPDTAVGMLRIVLDALKPGGILGVIDHVGVAGADNVKLHRMTKAAALEAVAAAGFEVVGESDLLANPNDDHSQFVFDPGQRGQTDRFLLKLRKPG